MSVINTHGIITLWNRAMEQITGIAANEAVGQFSWDVQWSLTSDKIKTADFYEQLRSNTLSSLDRCSRDAVLEVSEYSIQRQDGERRIVQANVSALQTGDDIYLSSVIRDITAEKAAASQFSTVSAAIEQSPFTVIITDNMGRIEYANAHLTEMTGYNLDEVRGKTSSIFKSGLTPIAIYEELWGAISHGEVWRGELQNRKKNGDLFWEKMIISPLYDDCGVIKHFVAVKEDVTRQKQVEAALRDSEERFRTLVSSTDDIIFTLDREQRHTGVYGRWLARNHLSPKDFIGKTASEVLGETHAQIHIEANQKALRGETVIYEWSKHDQSFQTSLAPVYDEAGQVSGIVGIGRDISALKLVEHQLEESERFALSTVNALSAEIAILDKDSNILTVNEAWCAFARSHASDPDTFCEGANYLHILEHTTATPEDRSSVEAFKAGLDSILRGEQQAFSLEFPRQSSQGVEWFTVRVTRFKGEGPLRLAVAYENITDRKQAELESRQANIKLDTLHKDVLQQNAQLEQIVEERTAELRHLHDRMATILNNTSDAIVLLDTDHRIQNVNLSFDQLFGYERDEAFGFPVQRLADLASAETLSQAVNSALDTSERQRIQIVAQGKNGQTFDADIALARMGRKSGHIICSVRDITHFKEVERVKDEFLSMVSHELRTPVTAVVLSADAVIRYYTRMTDDQKLHKLRQIRQQAENLTELVNSILDISRFNARAKQHIYTKVDVHQTLNDIVTELIPQAEGKRQQIQVMADSNSAIITGDYADVSRVWRNLINNAIKYTGEGSTISIKLHIPNESGKFDQMPDLSAFKQQLPGDLTNGSYLLGLVADNGPGIREQDIPQLFTRFFRGWAAGTTIPGTGLGLSLVKEILQSYQGGISVSSVQNVGTTFCFWLPLDTRSSK
jgi:two-component system, sensor histidine kinase and response regulator